MKILLPLAALAAGFLVTPALAQAVPDAAPRIVRHADLRLDTASGVARLDRRIEIAVREACGTSGSFDRAGRKAIERCRTATLAQATSQRDRVIAAAQANPGQMLAAR